MTSVAAELAALVARAQETVHAEDVVAWAADNPTSALHGAFEWDDATAAHQHRISHARRLLAIHVVDAAGDRRLVSLSVDRAAGGGYRRVADVRVDPEKASIMLRDALNELERVRKKYEKVRGLIGVWQEIDRAVQKHRPAADNAA